MMTSRLRKTFLGLGLLATLWLPYSASSMTDDTAAPIINHLLAYVEDSNCVFIRNDKEYNSKEAAKHLKGKYDYLMYKVKTAEDFIEIAGSKSTVSGKPYWVRCAGHSPVLSANWLMQELSDYRKRAHSHALVK
jgi:uncharacterized protein DUF5329